MFSVNERPMGLWLPVEGEPVLMVPHLELENAEAVPGVRVLTYPEYPGLVPPVLWMARETGATRLGIDELDARHLPFVQDAVARLDLADHCLPERVVKHPEELALIREAARYADMVLERLFAVGGDMIGKGATELDLMADATGHARAALARDHGAAFAGHQGRHHGLGPFRPPRRPAPRHRAAPRAAGGRAGDRRHRLPAWAATTRKAA
jgi:Xaa-Pro dipeptidase